MLKNKTEMITYKAIFWTGKIHRTIRIAYPTINEVVILLSLIVMEYNWNLIDLIKE